jgi:hypothetical protein
VTESRYAALDEALQLLRHTGPEYGPELANHGPMAAEALCSLGRGSAVVRWVEQYRKKLEARPARRTRIREAEWREALGDMTRVEDWSEFFSEQIERMPIDAVFRTWVARLAPGISAAAFHGVIRAGHAARALAVENTGARRDELADALGYWAAAYSTLPGMPGRQRAGALPSQAIARIATLPESQRDPSAPNIVAALRPLGSFEPFREVVSTVDPATTLENFLSDLTETFAEAFLANARDVAGAITFIHCLTGPAALRSLSPHLDRATFSSALAYAWQASAAIYARFGTLPRPDEEPAAPAWPRDDLIERALATADEHAIKFTDACLCEYRLNPVPAYLAAAARAVHILESSRR